MQSMYDQTRGMLKLLRTVHQHEMQSQQRSLGSAYMAPDMFWGLKEATNHNSSFLFYGPFSIFPGTGSVQL